MVSVSPSVQEEFDVKFDKYGDSYTMNAKERNLMKIFSIMNDDTKYRVRIKLPFFIVDEMPVSLTFCSL